jgi:hypothetical protein
MRVLALLVAVVLGACTSSGATRTPLSTPPATSGAATSGATTVEPRTGAPTGGRTTDPTTKPTDQPTGGPSELPTAGPTATPNAAPTSTPAPSVLAPLGWTKLRPDAGPTPREDHTWTVSEDGATAYLFGGRAGSEIRGDLWAYDLASDTWSEVAMNPGPPARFGHEAAWVPGRGLVIFAGQAGATFFNDLWLFDPTAGSWTELPAAGDVPVARYGTCSALGPDGRLWISHGFTEDGVRFSDTRAYDFSTGTWSDVTPEGRRPIDRCLHGCWFDADGSFALFGGQTTGVVALGDRWRLADPGLAGAAWTMLEAELPSPRNLYAHASTGVDRLVFGGRGKEGYGSDLWAFDLATASARPLQPDGETPPGRSGAELIVDPARGRALLFGGKHEGGTFQDLWQLSLGQPAG